MCGILGCVSSNSISKVKFSNALELIEHRGPDHADYRVCPIGDLEVALGHTRLSIIDLTADASQPFYSACERYVLIYNGEIYNYKELKAELISLGCEFFTESDTEVLLNAWIYWGKGALRKFIGMFSFAVLDKKAGKITLVRDAFGVKPLFYTFYDQELFFASELPALLKLRGVKVQADAQAAYDYLVHGDYDSSNRTFVEGVKHLKPGHYLDFDISSRTLSELQSWWQPDLSVCSNLSFDEAKDKLRNLFLQSVGLHLRSDVPLGAALSGGIDSSAVVCAIRHLEPEMPIHTFSYIASDEAISEEKWVDKINDYTAAIAHKVKASSDDLSGDIEKLLTAQGEPFGSTSIYAQYKVFQLARQTGIKVTLDGQGADELLAGYIGYPGERLLSLLEQKKFFEVHKFAKKWGSQPGRSYWLALRYLGRLILPDYLYRIARKLLGRDFYPNWLNLEVLREKGVNFKENRIVLEEKNKGNRVRETLARSLQHRGLPSLLRHGDRNAMAFSIESRVPFLTIPLAEFLLSLPEEYLVSDSGITKHVFREAMRGIVPDSHLDRKDKIGFETPQAEWVAEIEEEIRNWIADAPEIAFINKKEILKEMNLITKGKVSFSAQVWRWINYLRWYSLLDIETVENNSKVT